MPLPKYVELLHIAACLFCLHVYKSTKYVCARNDSIWQIFPDMLEMCALLKATFYNIFECNIRYVIVRARPCT